MRLPATAGAGAWLSCWYRLHAKAARKSRSVPKASGAATSRQVFDTFESHWAKERCLGIQSGACCAAYRARWVHVHAAWCCPGFLATYSGRLRRHRAEVAIHTPQSVLYTLLPTIIYWFQYSSMDSLQVPTESVTMEQGDLDGNLLTSRRTNTSVCVHIRYLLGIGEDVRTRR